MIDTIYELTLIVNQIKTRRIELIGGEKTKYGKLTKKLYKGILEGKYVNDREAAIDIYGPNFNPNNFTRLKIILTEKLINTLFFIDVSDYNFNDYQKAVINCEKLRAAVKILFSRSARKSAVKIAEKLVRKSMKYELTDITLEIARLLRRHYRSHDINHEKEKVYDDIVNHYYQLLGAEIKVENNYELMVKEANSKKPKEEIIIFMKKCIEEINHYFPKFESSKLGLVANFAYIYQHEFIKDYEAIARSCNRAIQYFSQKELSSSLNKTHLFYSRLLAVFIPLKRFEEGKKIVEKIMPSFNKGTINWYIAMDNYFLLSLHTGNYKKATEIYEEAVSNKRFRNLQQEYQELWRVYEAYLEYLRAIGELTTINQKRFRVSRFINEVPIFSKDKKGVNVAIIIIQILFLVHQGKEIKVYDKVDALRVYVHTYLRKDESLRSNCFIKMLLAMVKSNFHKNGTIRRTKTLHKKLISTPILEKSHSQFVEIIPYEQLWEMSLSQLSNKAY